MALIIKGKDLIFESVPSESILESVPIILHYFHMRETQKKTRENSVAEHDDISHVLNAII